LSQATETTPAAESSLPASTWILGPVADMVLFVATPLLIVPAVLLSRKGLSDQAIYAIVGTLGATGHHLPGMLRAYGDRALFHRFRIRLTVGPILLLGISVPLLFTNLRSGMDVVLALWGFWHGLMQVYGFLRIYAAKTGQTSARSAWIDWLMCLAWFGAGMVCSDGRVFRLLETFHRSGGPLIPTEWIFGFRNAWLVGTGVITTVFLVHEFSQRSRFRPATGIRLLAMAISFAFWWFAMVMIDNIIVGITLFEIFHDVQYLAIVWVFNRKRVEQAADVGVFTRHLFRRSQLMLVVYIALVAAYGVGTRLPEYLGGESLEELMVALIWISTLLHFYLDGFIWKVREQSTRAGLGLVDSSREETRPLTEGLVHALKWTPFLLAIIAMAASQWWNDYVFGDRRDRDAQVLARYHHLAKVVPGHDHAHLTLGTQLRKQGQVVQARQSIEKALQLSDGKNTEAHFQLAMLLSTEHDIDGTIRHHRIVLSREPKRTESRVQLALALQAQGDHDGSEQQLKKALELDDDLPATHVGLGRLYLETSRHAQARRHLQRAVSLLEARSERNSESDELLEMTRGLLEQAAATSPSRPDR
jgi:Flp pilus assembly protein TadD